MVTALLPHLLDAPIDLRKQLKSLSPSLQQLFTRTTLINSPTRTGLQFRISAQTANGHVGDVHSPQNDRHLFQRIHEYPCPVPAAGLIE